MQLPPDKVPEDLTADQYKRLHLLYALMGKQEQALEALNCAVHLISQERPTLEGDQDRVLQNMETLGQKFALNLVKIFTEAQNNPDRVPKADIMAILEPLKKELEASGASETEIDQIAESMTQALKEIQPEAPPPRDVQQGLSAQEYLKLGKKYKGLGWTEQARDSLDLAMELDPSGKIGKEALNFLRSKLPRHPVPLFAEQENVRGFNQMMAGDLNGAKNTFQELNEKYPDFEWPFGNLGAIYVTEGNLELAEETLQKALMINPYYVNAWMHLCRTNILASKFDGARNCLNRVMQIDPDDPSFSRMLETLATVEGWEKEN